MCDSKRIKLQTEAEDFDYHTSIRVDKGFIPDLRNLQKVTWFYNNPWREPEFAEIRWVPVLRSFVEKCAESGGSVLEVGCGHGMLSLELARANLNVVGVDLSPKAIEIAEKFKNKNRVTKNFGCLKYICCDFSDLDLMGDSFDNVVFFRSLHHFPNLVEVIEKVHSLLKADGNILFCEPIHNKFDHRAAEFALILRSVLPTWKSYKSKLDREWNTELWRGMVDDIYKEYVYEDEHHQSAMDKSTDSDEVILAALKPYFEIEYLRYHDAFINHIIGGLRGVSRFVLAKFLQFLDDYMVENSMLPPTSMTLFGKKKMIPRVK